MITVLIALTILTATLLLLLLTLAVRRRKSALPSAPSIGILHPHSLSGGGGERVLWVALQSIRHRYPNARIVLYCIWKDTSRAIADARSCAKTQFGVDIDGITFTPVDISGFAHALEATRYPRFTLLLQAFGMMYVGMRSYMSHPVDVFVDTANVTFSVIPAKILGATTVAYVHYPIISSDMLSVVRQRRRQFNNRDDITTSTWKSYVKVVYYRMFAVFYRVCSWFINVKIGNSSWTCMHLRDIWGVNVDVLYPPCSIGDGDRKEAVREKGLIVSVGQFRPEKRHRMQLEMMRGLAKGCCRLVMIGGVRNEEDERRADELWRYVKEHDLPVQLVKNGTRKELHDVLSRASVGLHTMKDEHFGISVVELMDAGLVVVAHDSGGVGMDIVENGVDGFVTDDEGWTRVMKKVLEMSEGERKDMIRRGREKVRGFAEDEFRKGFAQALPRSLND